MIVSTDMIEKYDRADDDDEGGCHLAMRSTGSMPNAKRQK